MCKSMSMTWYAIGWSRYISTASSPLLATATVCPSFVSNFVSTFTLIALSSTSSTWRLGIEASFLPNEPTRRDGVLAMALARLPLLLLLLLPEEAAAGLVRGDCDGWGVAAPMLVLSEWEDTVGDTSVTVGDWEVIGVDGPPLPAGEYMGRIGVDRPDAVGLRGVMAIQPVGECAKEIGEAVTRLAIPFSPAAFGTALAEEWRGGREDEWRMGGGT